ncbi:MAG: putative quinol monooxygenase [Pseudomonadota bacterium]
MSSFAIFVTVTLKPGTGDHFRPHILKNAEASQRDEPDCHLFKVMTDEDNPDIYYFYEVYSDAAALDHHRQQPHFLKFREATADMVLDRDVKRCTVLA